jgi:phospholipid-binding lipoprotein MlaA
MRFMFLLAVLTTAINLPIYAEEDFDEFVDPDPWRGMNQQIHNFNDILDVKLVRPVAVGYRKVTPQFFRTGVSNVFSNLDDVGDAVNNVLQGKVGDGMSDVVRVVVNSTIGIAGLFDPATKLGLVDHEEDFGQTFAVWKIPAGPYFVIPGLGPSTLRNTVSRFFDGAVDPVRYLYPVNHRNMTYAFRALQDRTDLLSVDGVVFGDKYIFYRDAYLQRREYLEKDGEVSDPFADDF